MDMDMTWAPVAAGGGGGSAMTFVHLNNETISSKEAAEEMVVQWRDLLATAGIEVGVYVIEPHLLLLDTQDKRKVARRRRRSRWSRRWGRRPTRPAPPG